METVNALLQTDMAAVNTHIERILASENSKMQEIVDWILQARGKQLRPKILLLSSRFGKKNSELVKLAAMLEIVHMASLVHDDVIDNCDVRRGFLSVQKKFGKHMAVYSGDFMIFRVVSEAAKSKGYKKYLPLYDVFQKLCYGELGQDKALFDVNISESEYIENISGKTASMFEAACELGAIASRATDDVKNNLCIYGKCLGILFQIRDDLLDYISNEEKLGKPVLQDFVNGIYTLPIIYSYADPASKKELAEIRDAVTEKGMTAELEKLLLKKVINEKGLEKTRAKAKEYYITASEALENLPRCTERDMLGKILDAVYNDI